MSDERMGPAPKLRFQTRPTGDFTSELSRRNRQCYDEEGNITAAQSGATTSRWRPRWFRANSNELPRMTRTITTADEEYKEKLANKPQKLGTFNGVHPAEYALLVPSME